MNDFSSIKIKPSSHTEQQPINFITGDVDTLSLEEQEKKRYGQDTKYRKILAHWVMFVVTGWLLCVLFIIAFNKILNFNIDNSVCITLLATTTVNVLGLAFIVLNGIFGGRLFIKKRNK